MLLFADIVGVIKPVYLVSCCILCLVFFVVCSNGNGMKLFTRISEIDSPLYIKKSFFKKIELISSFLGKKKEPNLPSNLGQPAHVKST